MTLLVGIYNFIVEAFVKVNGFGRVYAFVELYKERQSKVDALLQFTYPTII